MELQVEDLKKKKKSRGKIKSVDSNSSLFKLKGMVMYKSLNI